MIAKYVTITSFLAGINYSGEYAVLKPDISLICFRLRTIYVISNVMRYARPF